MANTENFYYVEGNSSVKNLVKTLATEITKNAGIYNWTLVHPKSLDEIGASTKGSVLNLITDKSKTTVVKTEYTVSSAADKCILKIKTSTGQTFYLKIDRLACDLTQEDKQAIANFTALHSYWGGNQTAFRTDADVLELMSTAGSYDAYVNAMTKSNALTNVVMQIGTELNSAGDEIVIAKGYDHRLAWYKKLQSNIKDFLPVQYWINVTNDSVNLVLRGDPSADMAPYSNYLTSYAYIGALKPVEDSATTDDVYNFAITTGSDTQPSYNHAYGERTATGVTDVCMIANKIGLPYQPHYPAFYATNPFMDKCNVEGSRWNHKKHQFSDITLVHPVDMERGKMQNILVGDASAIYDMDKLVYKKGTDEEENYKKFKITAPYCFLNNSVNNLYCIAIRCYKTTE